MAYRREPGPGRRRGGAGARRAMPAVSDGGRRLVFTPARRRPLRPARGPRRARERREGEHRAPLPGRGRRGAASTAASAARAPSSAEREGGIAGIVARDAIRRGGVPAHPLGPDRSCASSRCRSPSSCRAARRPPTQGAAGLASAGPYRVDRLRARRRIDLERNRGYAPGAAGAADGPDRIRVQLGMSSDEAVRRGRGGDVDYVMDRPTPEQVRGGAARARQVRRHWEGSDVLLLHEHPPGAVRRRARAPRREHGHRPPGAGRGVRRPGGADRPGCCRRGCRATASRAPSRGRRSPRRAAW